MSVVVTTPETDQARARFARAAAPETKTECVQAAIRALLAATAVDEYALAQELDQARKREVAEYVQGLADAVDRLTTLVGAVTDQADQFTGSGDAIAEVEHSLQCAHTGLSELADELHPING